MEVRSRNKISRNDKFGKIEILSEFIPSNIREAIRETVFNSQTSPKDIAKKLGLNYSLLANASNKNLPLKFSIKNLLPLMNAAENFVILKNLAHESQHGVFPLPDPKRNKTDQIILSCLGLGDRWGKVSKNLTNFLYKKTNSRKEKDLLCQKVERELWHLICSAAALRAILNKTNPKKEKENGQIKK